MRLILATAGGVGVWALMGGSRTISLPRLPRWWMASTVAGFLLGAGAGISWVASVGVGAMPIVIVEARRRSARRRATARIAARWPDFLAIVRGRIATGEPLPDAVRVAARSMGGQFSRLDRSWGGSFGDGLKEVQAEWEEPVADRVLTTIRVATETGGAHVDAVLSSLALSLADEIRVRRAHEGAIAQQQMTAGVALVAPWLILALSVATNPQASLEFSTSTGHFVLTVGAFATAIGYWLARRAARLSEPPRVFG